MVFLCSFVAHAQIETINPKTEHVITTVTNPGGTMIAKLSYDVWGRDTIYAFTFRDFRFKETNIKKAVIFDASNHILEEFESLLKSSFNGSPTQFFSLGKERILITNDGTYVYVYAQHGYVQLTKQQVRKLFETKQ